MKRIHQILLIFVIAISCNNENKKFERSVWKNSEGIYNGQRMAMVNDLLKKHLILGMEYGEVKEIIGAENRVDECTSNRIYELEEKYGKIDPNGNKYLELEFDGENRLIKWKIIETRFKE